jgi:hypothetical protein
MLHQPAEESEFNGTLRTLVCLLLVYGTFQVLIQAQSRQKSIKLSTEIVRIGELSLAKTIVVMAGTSKVVCN